MYHWVQQAVGPGNTAMKCETRENDLRSILKEYMYMKKLKNPKMIPWLIN